MPTPASTSPWATLLPTVLAGTRRQAPPALPGFSPSLGAEADASEKTLLLTAANLALVRRAGQRFDGPARALPRWPHETWPAVPLEATHRLLALLDEATQEEEESWVRVPQRELITAALIDLRQRGYRLPLPAALRVLRHRWAERTDDATARLVLGRRGQWLHQQLGNAHSPWYGEGQKRTSQVLSAPAYLLTHLQNAVCWPMPADDSYLPLMARLPAEQRTQLLWTAWQFRGGDNLPPPLQVELDELLAATSLAERPWHTDVRTVAGRAGQPRWVGHPQLARLIDWVSPLLTLEQPAGQPARLRVALPTAQHPAWEVLGTQGLVTHRRPDELESVLRQLLTMLGPRYWAERWQLTPAELVALTAAAERGQLVLEAWADTVTQYWSGQWAAPGYARPLLVVPQPPLYLLTRRGLAAHLPLAEQVAWLAAQLPTDPAAPHEPEWPFLLYQLPLHEPLVLRQLLPALAAALAQPRTRANAEQCEQLPGLLHLLAQRADPHQLPEVQAALGAVVPAQPKWRKSVALLLQTLALRLDLLHGCSPRAAATPNA